MSLLNVVTIGMAMCSDERLIIEAKINGGARLIQDHAVSIITCYAHACLVQKSTHTNHDQCVELQGQQRQSMLVYVMSLGYNLAVYRIYDLKFLSAIHFLPKYTLII